MAPRNLTQAAFRACALTTLAISFGLLGMFLVVGANGQGLLEEALGLRSMLFGTLITTAIGVVIAAPVGVLQGIYLSEFASVRMRRALGTVLNALVSVPTVAFGYCALLLVTPLLQGRVPGLGLGDNNALVPSLLLGLMIVPVIGLLTEAAIRNVPPALRETALALGASRVRALVVVVLPAASSAIAAAVLLAAARLLGEIVIVRVATGRDIQATLDPREPMATMGSYILQRTTDHRSLVVVCFVLLALTLATHAAARRLAGRSQRR